MKPLFALLAFGALGSAFAASCEASSSDAAWKTCLASELRSSDALINSEYQKLLKTLSTAQQNTLRSEQRQWLKTRDQSCKLDSKETNREKWFQKILKDPYQTVCVVRFTDARIEELKTYNPRQDLIAENYSADDYEFYSSQQYSKGKYYFEVEVNTPQIARKQEVSLYIGVASDHMQSGWTVNVRKYMTQDRKNIVGIAFDLDNGKIYTMQDGIWRDEPGGNTGLDLKLGQPYHALVSSSVSLKGLQNQKWVRINLGQEKFNYAIPKGYKAFSK
ncbi:lysozyme inhibitor LprI family protein [Deinococcus roseus]|nr:lysozyme inhibitor LprI family protein [Deinococcus roseus]